MSLLLDARKKSQQAQAAQAGDGSHSGLELDLEAHPNTVSSEPGSRSHGNSRSAGQNLFNAKSPPPLVVHTGINRNLLLALGGTVLLLAAGAGYLWHIDSTNNTQPLRPIGTPAAVPLGKPVPATTMPQNNLVPEIAMTGSADSTQSMHLTRAAPPITHPISPRPRRNSHIEIQPQQTELLDPLLNNAYLAYRSGKLDEARQMYLEMLGKDARNTDALLGLAVIAQQRGEDISAAQYYERVLAQDPRNAVANAGMSALITDDNNESRLKILLNQQAESASLHFALGNLYAGQSRWGEAQQAYFNAYTLDTKNAELAFNLAVSLEHLGQNKLAAQHYQRALQLDQSHSAGFDHAQIEQRVQELMR